MIDPQTSFIRRSLLAAAAAGFLLAAPGAEGQVTAVAATQTIPIPGVAAAVTEDGGAALSRSGNGPLAISLLPYLRAALPAGAPVGDDTAGKIALFGPRIDLLDDSPAEEAAPKEPEKRQYPVAALWPLDPVRVTGTRAQFRGERESLDFALFVPPGTAPTELTVAAVSSAYTLPGRSILRVYTRDQLIGEVPLRSITAPEKVSLPLRSGMLSPGFNPVRIEVQSAHRLYCGAKAGYDLWTSVDLAQSGVSFVAEQVAPSAESFLAAAAVARGRGLPLLVRAASGGQPEADDLLQRVSLQLGRAMGSGLTFTASDTASRRADFAAPVIEMRDSGRPGVFFRTDADGRHVMEVRTDGTELPALFAAVPEATATLQGIPVLPRDVPVPLEALGFSTVQISQHLWSQGMEFRLPADWLINVRKRAVLELGYAYLPGMPTGSELRVLFNGKVVRMVPLDRGGRLDELPLEVRFDAGLLKAGRNHLAFEVNVPGDPADQPCPIAEVGRVEIDGRSTLTIPSSPSMHMPGISRWMSVGGEPAIETGASDGSEQWNLLLRLASALRGSGGEAEAGGAEKRLVLLRPTDLSRGAFGEFSVGRQVMLSALQPPPQGTPRPATAVAENSAPPATMTDLRSAMSFTVENPGIIDMIGAEVSARGRRALNGLVRLTRPDPVSDLGEWLSGKRGQAVLFQLDHAAPDDLHLLVADEARIDEVVAALESVSQRGVPLEGHVALLTWDRSWLTWADETRLPVLREDLTESNWRGVIGNFASARPIAFVGLLIGISLVSVMIASSYVSASRRRR